VRDRAPAVHDWRLTALAVAAWSGASTLAAMTNADRAALDHSARRGDDRREGGDPQEALRPGFEEVIVSETDILV
jgi:hypothetical protein